MKQILSIFAVLWCSWLMACNSCGCFIGTGLSGVNLQNSKWQFRQTSLFRSFDTHHPADEIFTIQRHTQEIFWQNNFELSYQLKPWLYAAVTSQVTLNEFSEDGLTKRFMGLGNIGFALTTQKRVLEQANGNNAFWINRVSFAVPGKQSKSNSPDENQYSEALYPSIGANTLALSSQVLYNTPKSVYYVTASLSANGRSEDSYRFGHSIQMVAGVANDVLSLGESKTMALGAELSLNYSAPNQYLGKKLPDNNGSYSIINIQVGYKSPKMALFVKKAFVLQQNIGSGFTQIKQQIELNLTFNI